MENPIWPLQVAVKQKADTDITGYKVYDDVPENEPVDYIVLGDFEFTNESNKTHDMMEITHTFTVWSQYNGTKKVCEMLNKIIQTFDGFAPDLTAAGFKVRFARWERGKISRYDRDGVIYRYGHVSFRYIIQDQGG